MGDSLMKVLFVSSGRRERTGAIVFSQGESLRETGIAVDYVLAGPGLAGYLSAIARIRKAWKTGDYDLVHAHYSLSAFTASLAGRFPLVVSLMGSDVFMSGLIRIVIRVFYRHRWDVTIVKSLQIKDMLGLEKAEVVPNGVDIRLFSPAPREDAREHLGFPLSGKLVLFGSSAERREKNAELARKAVEILNDPEIELRYLSGIPHKEVPHYLNAADVLLLTSEWEGSPNVVKEAMACNCPVVSTDVGDVRWLMEETGGCFITSNDAGDVAAKLRAAMDFNARTEGRKRIMSLGIDSGSVAERIRLIYERVIS
ncbi:MAG: glycosyltransferase [Bacteroidales bacterium]|nr:glycosyltransferase [Bacteroidales bacterium]